jgi:tetratricopeptide (TPR) repeat protein
MNDEGNDRDRLINAAIKASIEFEELMDKTDFDSWLDVDSHETLKNRGQLVDPFINYKDNEKKLKEICYQMKREVINNSSNSVVNSSLEEYPISKLFDAKIKRLEARICSNKNDEQEKYKEALHYLLSALNDLQNPEWDNKMCLILLYNDLSICYAGLDNSSMSRGYAEDVRKIIEKEKSYKEFEKKWSASNSKNLKDIEGLDFVSSKLFKLYTIALFNQAEAKRRTNQYTEAEKNFKKIIKYGEENTCLINFNHYSAILYLSLLYIDQGRGKEAIELLEKVINKSNEADIRYWKAFIAKSQALIDQSEYDKAILLLST